MRLTIPNDVVFRTVGDEAVILNFTTGQYHGLDAVGSRIWELLTAMGSQQRACERLVEEFDADPDRLRVDVDELVSQLVRRGLLAVSEDGEPAGRG